MSFCDRKLPQLEKCIRECCLLYPWSIHAQRQKNNWSLKTSLRGSLPRRLVGALETSIWLLWCGALSAREWESFSSNSSASSGNNRWPPRSTRPSSGARCYGWRWCALRQCYILSWRRWATEFTCFERLSAVSHAVTVGHSPCTLAIAREIANGDAALQNRLITRAKYCVQPGLNFFQQKFNVQFLTNVRAFKAARLRCPVQVSALRPDARSLEELKSFPFVDDATIANLATEPPLYLSAVDGVMCDSEEEKLVWWAAHRDTLPHWVALVRKLLLVQPSSAAAERVFSFLNTLPA